MLCCDVRGDLEGGVVLSPWREGGGGGGGGGWMSMCCVFGGSRRWNEMGHHRTGQDRLGRELKGEECLPYLGSE